MENPNASTFRLKSFSENRFNETVRNNLHYILKILRFNKKNNILFFRISSDIIPFASHPICQSDWSRNFKAELNEIGDFKKNDMRVSLHPGQFVILNSTNEKIIENSIRELQYRSKILESMALPTNAKIQIHVGGVYGDKNTAKERLVSNLNKLERRLKERIIIENDDKSYSLKDCLDIHKETGNPIVFDTLHHECLNHETMQEALSYSAKTWEYNSDGNPIIDYSSQNMGEKKRETCKNYGQKSFYHVL